MNLSKLKKSELIEYIRELEKKILTLEEEAQDTRIKQAYAEFDSEATRRENDYLKKLLNDRVKNDEEEEEEEN